MKSSGKIQCNRFCLISVGVRTVLIFWISIKNLGQYKKLKNIFRRTFHRTPFFLRVAIFSWIFSLFFRIVNVYQFFFTLNILFDKVDSREVETQKKYFGIYHFYSYFLRLVPAIFIKFLFFQQIIALQKLWKMLFISSKKALFVPSFSPCRPLL